MHYVYLLRSEVYPDKRYVGFSDDLKTRIKDHNAGRNTSTAPFKPWRIVTYLAFEDRNKAEEFEAYLKSGSGHAFARKRLWS